MPFTENNLRMLVSKKHLYLDKNKILSKLQYLFPIPGLHWVLIVEARFYFSAGLSHYRNNTN